MGPSVVTVSLKMGEEMMLGVEDMELPQFLRLTKKKDMCGLADKGFASKVRGRRKAEDDVTNLIKGNKIFFHRLNGLEEPMSETKNKNIEPRVFIALPVMAPVFAYSICAHSFALKKICEFHQKVP